MNIFSLLLLHPVSALELAETSQKRFIKALFSIFSPLPVLNSEIV